MRINEARFDDAPGFTDPILATSIPAEGRADGAEMIGVGIALVWIAVVAGALVGCAFVERWSRLAGSRDRPEWQPPRAAWGFDPQPSPNVYLLARTLAGSARLVRSRTVVDDQSPFQNALGRIVSCVALASALALIPFIGTWGGEPDGAVLVVADLHNGLIGLVFLLLMVTVGRVATGLALRSVWSRLGSVGIASRSLAGVGLFVLVLAPLVLETGSLRLHDIAMTQQSTFAPLSWLSSSASWEGFGFVRALRWPGWHLFTQPLTAILFVFALAGLMRRPCIYAATTGRIGTSGFGLDGDPQDLYWGRLEARLSKVLAASLFVSLFLGAGAIPFVAASAVVDLLEPFFGFELSALLGVLIQLGMFVVKLWVVLVLASILRRATATIRDDQWIDIVTSRLFPLAWANLLLMSALTLLSDSVRGGL